VSSDAVLLFLGETFLSSTLFLGIVRSGSSLIDSPAFNPFEILESASSDALNFLLGGRLSGSDLLVLVGKPSLVG
jgi:hypothetical protein